MPDNNLNVNTGRAHEWVEIPMIGKPNGYNKEGQQTFTDEKPSINTLIGKQIPSGYRIIGYEEIMAGSPLMKLIARSQSASFSDDINQQQVDADLQAELLRVQGSDNPSKLLTNQYSDYNHLPEDMHAQYANMTREETWSLESDEFYHTPDGLGKLQDECNPDKLRVRGFRKTSNWVKDEMFGSDNISDEEWRQCKSLAFMLHVVNDTDNTNSNQYWIHNIQNELSEGIMDHYVKLQEICDSLLVAMGDIDHETGYTITSGDILPHGDLSGITVSGGGYAPPPTNDWVDSDNRQHDSDLAYTFKDFALALNSELQHALKRVSTKPLMIKWREENNITEAKGSLFYRTLQKLAKNGNILKPEGKKPRIGDHPFSSYGSKKIEELCWRLFHATTQSSKVDAHVTSDMSIQSYYRNRDKYQPRLDGEASPIQ